MTRNDIYEAVSRERDRQDRIHGPALEVRDIPRILGEEFGEVCAAINDRLHRDRVVEELIQCAAVCVKAIESIDRSSRREKYVDIGAIRNVDERDAERHRDQCMWPEEHDFVSTADGDFACTKCTMRRGATAIAAMQSLNINPNRVFDSELVKGGDE